MHKLCAWATSEDPDRAEEAQLYLQPGSYGCSTPDIDRMVDLACSVEGVVGAQIAFDLLTPAVSSVAHLGGIAFGGVAAFALTRGLVSGEDSEG